MLSTQQAGRSRETDLKNDYGSLVELASNEPESKNWKGIGIAVAVIVTVFGAVALTAYLFTEEPKEITVSTILQSDVFEEKWRPTKVFWIGSHLIFQDRRGNVVKIESRNGQPIILIPRSVMVDKKIDDFQISRDGNYALLAYDRLSVSSYFYNSSYYIYDIARRAIAPFKHDDMTIKFQFVQFGAKSRDVVYYVDGNLYYKENVHTKNAVNLTSDGKHGIYQNGLPDWLYEEEIFKGELALWRSPSGRHLAYASFDDREVDDEFVTLYDVIDDVTPYPKTQRYKCPKAGQRNPTVKVHVFDLELKDEKIFSAPTSRGENMEILRSGKWMSDEQMLITWSNSALSSSVTLLCDVTVRNCINVIRAKENVGQSVTKLNDLNDQILASPAPGLFFQTLMTDYSGRQFKHLAVMNISEKPMTVKFLTEGNWEVTKILHHDVTRGIIYYVSNEELPGSRHVYKVTMDGRKSCITCNNVINDVTILYSSLNMTLDNEFSYGPKNQCLYYDASFGTDSDWFQVTCLGPILPFTGLVSLNYTLRGDSGDSGESFELLVPPTTAMKKSRLPERRIERFWQNGVEIYFKMLLPDRVHVGRRPIIFVMGDFGAQRANFQYNLDLTSYVIVNSGAVGIYIDRIDSSSSNDISQQALSKPGETEIEDMIAVLEYIGRNQHIFESVDSTNAGVIGVSGYGGYTSILAMKRKQIVCGLAINPVNDWRSYNSIGAAMIPGSSEDNALYSRKNNKNIFNNFKDSKLRILHDLQNRREIVQHSMLLEEALLLSNVTSDAVQIFFLPTFDRQSEPQSWRKIEANLYLSVTLYMRDCLYQTGSTRQMKLELLESACGRPS